MRASEHDPEAGPAAGCPPADELVAWRAEKAAERMALLRLPKEVQAQADLFQAGRRDWWDVELDHEAYLNRLPDLPPRRQEAGDPTVFGSP